MSATYRTGSNQDDGTARTLGALLCPTGGRTRVPERHWVDLLRAIAARDPRALRALYDRTHRIVFTLTMRITGNRQTAEELTVDVYHDVWRRAAAYDPKNGSVLGWMLNQARSRAVDRVRFERRKKRSNGGVDPSDAATTASGLDDLLELRAQARKLRDALEGLTADERRAIETAFFGELSYAEAADQLQEPVGTIKTRIRSALGKLRRTLTEEQP